MLSQVFLTKKLTLPMAADFQCRFIALNFNMSDQI